MPVFDTCISLSGPSVENFRAKIPASTQNVSGRMTGLLLVFPNIAKKMWEYWHFRDSAVLNAARPAGLRVFPQFAAPTKARLSSVEGAAAPVRWSHGTGLFEPMAPLDRAFRRRRPDRD